MCLHKIMYQRERINYVQRKMTSIVLNGENVFYVRKSIILKGENIVFYVKS